MPSVICFPYLIAILDTIAKFSSNGIKLKYTFNISVQYNKPIQY